MSSTEAKDQTFQDLQYSSGFAILAVIAAMTVAITLFMTIASIIDFQNKRTRALSLKLDSLEVENFIVTVLSSRENCQCQFENQLLNLSATPIADLTLTEIRSGCDFLSLDNIIVKQGEMAKDIPGVEVDSIVLRNISLDPDNNRLYNANLTVQYTDVSGNNQPIRPSILDFKFFIDPSNLTNAQIQSCFTPVLGSHECRRGVNEQDTLAGCEGTIDVTGGVTSFGHKAGHSETESLPPSSGPGNTFVGASAGQSNTSGQNNTFIGYESGESNQTGNSNVYIYAKRSLISVDAGNSDNTMLGEIREFTGSSNVFISGYYTRNAILNNNVYIGKDSGEGPDNGDKNVFIGSGTGSYTDDSTVNNSVLIGRYSGHKFHGGEEHTFIGYYAGSDSTRDTSEPQSGLRNTYIGSYSGEKNQGYANTFIGAQTGRFIESGTNTLIGRNAGQAGTAGAGNTMIGAKAGENLDSGSDNTSIGYEAGYKLGVGENSTFIGSYSGTETHDANNNTFIGSYSGASNTSGASNIFVGFRSSYGNTVEDGNVSFGYEAGPQNAVSTMAYSTFLGAKSGNYVASAQGDVIVGYEAGQYAGVPNENSHNTIAGNYALTNNNFSGNWAGQGEYIHHINYGTFSYIYTSDCRPDIWVPPIPAQPAQPGLPPIPGIPGFFIPPPPWPCPYSSASSSCQCFASPQAIGSAQTLNDPCGGAGPNLQYCYAEEGDSSGATHASACSGVKTPRQCPGYPSTSSSTTGTRRHTTPEPRTDCKFGTSYYDVNGYDKTQVLDLNTRMWCCGCRYDRSTKNLLKEVTIVGHEAGENACGEIVAIGHQAGQECQPGVSFYIGAKAGSNNVGEGNIFIGHKAGADDSTINHAFIVGNENTPQWMYGELYRNWGKLYVNGNIVVISSSRSLKTDITLFEDYEQALEDIVETPLFTYKYKHSQDFPNKTRWGVISEELPDHLQLIQEGKPSHPDWPSIYGSFWASIKALYQRITSLNQALEEFGTQFKSYEQLVDIIFNVQQEMVEFKRQAFFQVSELSRQIYDFINQKEAHLEQARLQLEDIRNLNRELQDQLAKTEERIQNLESSQK